MNLHRLLQQRATAGKPVRVGLIGADKFGSMFLNLVPTMAGLEISVIADLDPEGARNACRTVGWDAARIARTRFVASGAEACSDPGVEVVVEATGSPPAGIAQRVARSPPVNTSSWSTSRPMSSPARSWPKERGPRAPYIRSLMATSRR